MVTAITRAATAAPLVWLPGGGGSWKVEPRSTTNRFHDKPPKYPRHVALAAFLLGLGGMTEEDVRRIHHQDPSGLMSSTATGRHRCRVWRGIQQSPTVLEAIDEGHVQIGIKWPSRCGAGMHNIAQL